MSVDPTTLCVVGTLAFDDVETPAGKRTGLLGGSATYFSIASSYFTDVGIVGVVGQDFPDSFRSVLTDKGVRLDGLDVSAEGKTFHWAGRYEGAMDQAETLQTDLNVLETFQPTLPASLSASPYVFLANIDPKIQHAVLNQLSSPSLVVMDTMNLWIDIAQDRLLAAMKRVDGVVLNDAEAKMLAKSDNLIAAGKWLLAHGPKRFVVIKQGEHGAILVSHERLFALPAYPLEDVVDPTGAGDSFAGGLMGYLAGNDAASGGTVSMTDVCEAMVYGTCVASFTVSDFSLDQLATLGRGQIDARVAEFKDYITL